MRAVSRMSSALTENGEHGARPIRSIEYGFVSCQVSITRRLS